MNSGDFSKFIVSFGSMNNYQSSVDETKQFLEDKENIMLPQSDKALIYDALDGIAAIRNQGFNSNGIIEVNKAFIYSKEEDPQWPGHLRNDIYNPDDAIGIITNPNGTTKDAYYPPNVVYKGDLDDIVTEFNFSRKTERDAWKVFAKISKLQPFQDGNNRTVTRYILKQKTLGLFFLALTPVIDLILLITTGIDLMNGATAATPHAIAAVYISVSLVFGKSMINWADDRFGYYVMKQGPKPYKPVGLAYSKNYAKSWLKHLLSYIIGTGILHLIIFLINDKSRTEAMDNVIHVWTIVIIIDLIICISYFVWPPKNTESKL